MRCDDKRSSEILQYGRGRVALLGYADFLLISIFLVALAYGNTNAMLASKSVQRDKLKRIDTLSVCPNGRAFILAYRYTRFTRLFLASPERKVRKIILAIPQNIEAASFVWSKDGKHLAFVTYNARGHSPMTTTHTWVVDSTGKTEEVVLPPPYSRFSTLSPKWGCGDSLFVKALILSDRNAIDQPIYVYIVDTKKVRRYAHYEKEGCK